MNHPGDQEVERAREQEGAGCGTSITDQLYEAYLWGCEDECVPEPLTREKFAEKFGLVASSRDAERIAARGPIPVVIDCPVCGCSHVDKGEWATKPHKTHQCQSCQHEWRPFPVATVGIHAHDFPARIVAYADASQKSLVAELVGALEKLVVRPDLCGEETLLHPNGTWKYRCDLCGQHSGHDPLCLLARAREGAKP